METILKPQPTLKKKILYNNRIWVNNEDTPSSGSLVCFDGVIQYDVKEAPERTTFAEFGSCHEKIRLHKTPWESNQDFIDKIERVYAELGHFLDHLKDIENDASDDILILH